MLPTVSNFLSNAHVSDHTTRSQPGREERERQCVSQSEGGSVSTGHGCARWSTPTGSAKMLSTSHLGITRRQGRPAGQAATRPQNHHCCCCLRAGSNKCRGEGQAGKGVSTSSLPCRGVYGLWGTCKHVRCRERRERGIISKLGAPHC